MRRIIFAISIISAVCSIAAAQQKTIKRVEVTKLTIAAQPKGQPYIIDATKTSTVYIIEDGVELSRVRVRVAGDVLSLSEIAKRERLSGKLLVGQSNDVLSNDVLSQNMVMDTAARTTGYSCGELTCKCRGFGDCLRMGEAGVCKGKIKICDDRGCVCFLIFARS